MSSNDKVGRMAAKGLIGTKAAAVGIFKQAAKAHGVSVDEISERMCIRVGGPDAHFQIQTDTARVLGRVYIKGGKVEFE